MHSVHTECPSYAMQGNDLILRTKWSKTICISMTSAPAAYYKVLLLRPLMKCTQTGTVTTDFFSDYQMFLLSNNRLV